MRDYVSVLSEYVFSLTFRLSLLILNESKSKQFRALILGRGTLFGLLLSPVPILVITVIGPFSRESHSVSAKKRPKKSFLSDFSPLSGSLRTVAVSKSLFPSTLLFLLYITENGLYALRPLLSRKYRKYGGLTALSRGDPFEKPLGNFQYREMKNNQPNPLISARVVLSSRSA